MIIQTTLTPNSIFTPCGSPTFISFPNLYNINTFNNNSITIRCSSISNVHNYGTVDYERRPLPKWTSIFKRITTPPAPVEGEELGPQVGPISTAEVLNQVEKEGKRLTKWELCRLVRELRKFRRYNLALEVYEWMNNRIERFKLSGSDAAIQLDLIAKVRGVTSAEDYFTRVPETLKDKRIYGALLNAYVGAKMKDKAETLMERIRNKGYAIHPLPYNVMMTLYMKLGEYERVEELISEMRQRRVSLDLYTYNIWLSARGSRASAEVMEQVFEQMNLDATIVPNWTTFSTMAALYIRLGKLEKAEECLRNMEIRITGRDKMPYHYLMSLYGSVGKKEEVYRVWDIYKSIFPSIPNWGYHSVISALVRLGDIEGAEKLYEEWLPVKSSYDPKVGNLLMGWYVKDETFEKVKGFFDHMIEVGGKPNSTSWEILGEGHLKEGRISEALDCFKKASTAEGAKNWRPKPPNVSAFLELCEQEANCASKEDFVALLTQMGCLQDERYQPYLTGHTSGVVGNGDEKLIFTNGSDYGTEETDNSESELLFSGAE